MTTEQMQIADALDELEVGQTLEIKGHYITRESPTRYEIDGQRDRYCFIQAYDFLSK